MGDRPRGEPIERGRALSGHFEQAFDLDRRIGGSAATPTVERACLPLSPKAATIRSEAPFITFGPSTKPGAEFMKPPSRTTRTTLSRSPSAALTCASRLTAQARAAFCPSSIETPPPSLSGGDKLAFTIKAKLAGYHEHVAGAHERDVVGDRRRPASLQARRRVRFSLLLHRAGHFASSSPWSSLRQSQAARFLGRSQYARKRRLGSHCGGRRVPIFAAILAE